MRKTNENLKILVADDEEDFQQLMKLWLTSKGYSVIIAQNGESAVEKVREESPDIVFMDLNMPGMGGIKALAAIREFNKTIPVIIISAYVGQMKLTESEQYGLSGVFYKGEDFEKGAALIEAALRTHKKLKSK